jgi:serine/threonine protein kinase
MLKNIKIKNILEPRQKRDQQNPLRCRPYSQATNYSSRYNCAFVARSNIAALDLKPANILLDAERGSFKIADFGLAIESKGAKAWFGHAGTAGFTSPEVYLRQNYDERVDCFALGAIYAFIVCGKPIFWNEEKGNPC